MKDMLAHSAVPSRKLSSEPRSILGQGPARGGPVLPLILGLLGLLVGCVDRGEVENPTPLYGEIPIEYPLDLWDADVEGQTTLRVRVTEMGTVDSVEVIEPSGYPAFDSAAVQGALQLQYNPARRKGKRISVWARVPVQFTKGELP